MKQLDFPGFALSSFVGGELLDFVLKSGNDKWRLKIEAHLRPNEQFVNYLEFYPYYAQTGFFLNTERWDKLLLCDGINLVSTDIIKPGFLYGWEVWFNYKSENDRTYRFVCSGFRDKVILIKDDKSNETKDESGEGDENNFSFNMDEVNDEKEFKEKLEVIVKSYEKKHSEKEQ